MTGDQDTVTGTLLRGADGSLYYVSDQDLSQFRIDDEKAARVEQKRAEGGTPAVHFSDAHVQAIARVDSVGPVTFDVGNVSGEGAATE